MNKEMIYLLYNESARSSSGLARLFTHIVTKTDCNNSHDDGDDHYNGACNFEPSERINVTAALNPLNRTRLF